MAYTDDAWEIRRQAEAQRLPRRDDLADIEEMLAQRAGRAGRSQSTWSPPEPPPPVPAHQRSPQPAVMARDWAAEEKWISAIVDRKITALIDKGLVPLADEIGKDLAAVEKQITAQEDRAAKSNEAAAQQLADLDRRLVALEGLVVGMLAALNGPAGRAAPKPAMRLVEEVPDAAA